jgi:hypothetical protein
MWYFIRLKKDVPFVGAQCGLLQPIKKNTTYLFKLSGFVWLRQLLEGRQTSITPTFLT